MAYALRLMAFALAGATLLLIGANAPARAQTGTYEVRAFAVPSEGGTVTVSGDDAFFNSGDTVTITATANSGYAFLAWEGCPGATTNVCTRTVNWIGSVARITAYFTSGTKLLTAVPSPSGGGTVTPSPTASSSTTAPSGISAYHTYAHGTAVTVTASPSAGYRFDGWSGACTGAGSCRVTMSANRYVSARFVRQYTLTTPVSPSGGGTVSGGGSYDWGTWVTLTATPSTGYTFGWWTNGTCSLSNPCRQRVIRDRTTTAHFVPHPVVATAASPSAGGAVSGGGTYAPGTEVTLTATPNPGYALSGWTANALLLRANPAWAGPGSDPPVAQWLVACTDADDCVFSAAEAVTVTATFVRGYTLTAIASPAAGGAVSGGGDHLRGSVVALTASANAGYRFDGWGTGGGGALAGCDSGTTCQVTLSASTVVVARFKPVYTVTVSASPSAGGSVSGGGAYTPSTTAVVVTLTATPNTGYRFGGWSLPDRPGACPAGGATCRITIVDDLAATARFVRTHALTTTASPGAGGTVTGAGTYDAFSVVTLTATPNAGYRFSSWSGGCSGGGSCAVFMTADRSVTATFASGVTTYTITASATPSAGGTVSGGGTYNTGTEVTLSATPNVGYEFSGWSGTAGCTGSDDCTVTLSANGTAIATFSSVTTYALSTTASPSSGGTVTGGGTYNTGTEVTLTATPADGYGLERWSGDCTGSGACTVTMSAARTVTAHFIRVYTVQIHSIGGSVTGAGAYPPGADVTITATPDTGYRFDRWSGASCGPEPSLCLSRSVTFTLTSDRLFRAHYIAIPVDPPPPPPPPSGNAGSGGNTGGGGSPVGGGGSPSGGGGGGGGASGAVDSLRSDVGVTITPRVRGEAPDAPTFRFRYDCALSGSFDLGVNQPRRFASRGAAPCTLTVTDDGGATQVSGRITYPRSAMCAFFLAGGSNDLFTERAFAAGEYLAEIVFTYVGRTDEILLTRGVTFFAWPGAGERSIADGLSTLATIVTAVYSWDASAQRWRSWFPGGAALGVNTLAAFEPGGIYAIAATNRLFWRVAVDEAWRAPATVRLARGITFFSWPGVDERSVGDALGSLVSVVPAVYFWDVSAQRWRSWFPGGERSGVNTLSSFEPGGIYAISSTTALDWLAGADAGGLPAC